ncbi:hypothetical protein [Streptomyces misionensis]|uniref:hypothetical protein n=1 Tax=Streptomyces misionensis TaxID=67331 RepID=UPI00339E1766
MIDEVREEFRAGWRKGAEYGVRDELHRLGTWTRRLPAGLARFTHDQLRALWRVTVCLLRDTLRGTPVLAGILARGLTRGARAALRASTGAGAAASTKARAKPAGPAAEEEGQETAPVEEAQFAADAPAGPPWKRRRGTAKALGKQAPPAAPSAAVRGGPADVLERVAVGFLVLAVGATFGGMALGALGSLLAPYARGIVFGLAVVWCLAAAMVAPRDEEPTADVENPTENDHEESAGETQQESDPWPARREAIRAFVEEEVAAGAAGHREAKGKGAPVDALLAELQRRGVAEVWGRDAMIDILRRAGITVRPQMKFRIGGKQKTPPGVHIDDLANDLGFRPRLPSHLVPDLTPPPGPSRLL